MKIWKAISYLRGQVDHIKKLNEKYLHADNFIYLRFILCIFTAEIFIAYGNIYAGVSFCLFNLLLLILTAFLKYRDSNFPLYLALSLFPLIRIVSIAIPATGIPETIRFAVVGVPLFLIGGIVAIITGLTPRNMGFAIDKPHRQLLIALLGPPLGFIAFFINRPALQYTTKTPVEIMTEVFILIVFTGLLEEFLYRGILFNIVSKLQGDKFALYFTSLLYAIMTVSGKSLGNVIYVFFLSILFCKLIGWTKSILGLTLAHGLINITIYIICPQIFK